MAQDPPQLKLAGLMQFDTKQLAASLDLRARVGLDTQPPSVQTLSFQADATQRKVAFSGATAGSLDVKVDASQAASLGSPDQQARALKSYMSQFDQAATRGHADGGLMTLFKETFSALHSSVGDAPQLSLGDTTPGKWQLAAQEQRHADGPGRALGIASANPEDGQSDALVRAGRVCLSKWGRAPASVAAVSMSAPFRSSRRPA